MDLKDTFLALSKASLDQYIANRQEENLQLEFKTVGEAGMTRDDRKNFAIATSGFANSSGGIVVWGIVARKNDQDVDCAQEYELVDNVQLMLTRLNQHSGQATSPLVDGLTHRAIAFDEQDRGCVLTLVPESATGPHMAKLGEDRYYKRSGDSFRKMEHFDLQDMFGRRMRPALIIHLDPRVHEPDTTQEELHIYLRNIGRALAKHVGFIVRFEGATIKGRIGNLTNLSEINRGRQIVGYSDDHGVIHPNGINLHTGHVVIRRTDQNAPYRVSGTLYCESMAHIEFGLDVAPLPQQPQPSVEPARGPEPEGEAD